MREKESETERGGGGRHRQRQARPRARAMMPPTRRRRRRRRRQRKRRHLFVMDAYSGERVCRAAAVSILFVRCIRQKCQRRGLLHQKYTLACYMPACVCVCVYVKDVFSHLPFSSSYIIAPWFWRAAADGIGMGGLWNSVLASIYCSTMHMYSTHAHTSTTDAKPPSPCAAAQGDMEREKKKCSANAGSLRCALRERVLRCEYEFSVAENTPCSRLSVYAVEVLRWPRRLVMENYKIWREAACTDCMRVPAAYSIFMTGFDPTI